MIIDRNLITLFKLQFALELNLLFIRGSSGALRRVQKYAAMLTDEEGNQIADLVRRRLTRASDIKANSIQE